MTIWIEKPKRVYIVKTDQAVFKVKRSRLDYSQTVATLKAKGYTNINISFIGYDVTI